MEYVGINVDLDQDPWVLPLLKGHNWTFTPLRGGHKFAKEAYNVRGSPTNFLIDQNGKIVYTNFTIENTESERLLELMIESLLRTSGS